MDSLLEACRKTIIEYYGENPQKSGSYGRIVSTRQFDRLKGLLDGCDPSQIVIGGETDREDLYIAPTIVSPVDPNTHVLMEQEIFGPILPIIPVENMDEAIAIVNARYVWIGTALYWYWIWMTEINLWHSMCLLVPSTITTKVRFWSVRISNFAWLIWIRQ